MPHTLCKISARSAQQFGGHSRKIMGVHHPPCTGEGYFSNAPLHIRLGYPVEMQSSGPAAQPGFCGARTTSAGLMPGSGEAITMYYALAAGLRAVLERCWPGSMLGSADFVRCRSGLGPGFWRNVCTSSPHPSKLRSPARSFSLLRALTCQPII